MTAAQILVWAVIGAVWLGVALALGVIIGRFCGLADRQRGRRP